MQKQPTKRTTSEIKIPPPPHPLHTPLILDIIYRKNRNEIFIIRQSKIFFISISRLLLLGSAKESLACLRFPMAWDSCEKDCSREIKREREGEKMLAKSIKICQKLKTLSFSLRRRVLYLFKQISVKTKHRTYGQRETFCRATLYSRPSSFVDSRENVPQIAMQSFSTALWLWPLVSTWPGPWS